MPLDDIVRFRHMLESAQEAVGFTQGREKKDLLDNRQLLLAVVKAIEIVGEAARSIPVSTRDQHPQIPWPAIIGMRHRLVHVYFEIDVDVVWQTVTEDLPPLITQLESVLGNKA